LCNAAALKDFGVPIIPNLNIDFTKQVENWLNQTSQKKLTLGFNTATIVEKLMEQADLLKAQEEMFNEYELDHLSLKFR
jgi:hypothetical protein